MTITEIIAELERSYDAPLGERDVNALLAYVRALEEVAYQAKMTGDTSETLRGALADLAALRGSP